jgi:1-acyl-sn-glycerol-3-phosphate acyltransferase
MKYLLFPVKLFYHLYAFAVFVGLMLLVLPFVVIATLFGRVIGGNITIRLCQFWADVMFFLGGLRQTNTYLSPHDPKKRYVFVVNHISYLDPPAIIKAIRKQPFRVLGKYEMTKFPIFGFIYRNAAIMVDRSSVRNRAKSIHLLRNAVKKNISIVVFPEGTFNETGYPLKRFFDGAFRIAIETQTPVKPVLLLDTYDRLNYKSLFSLSPGISRVVFLDEISVNGLTMKDVQVLKDKVYKEMEQKLLFYNASWIRHTKK